VHSTTGDDQGGKVVLRVNERRDIMDDFRGEVGETPGLRS